MSPVVVLDAATGDITRYHDRRVTHRATAGGPVGFTPELVEGFRAFPDPAFYVGPIIVPPDPTPGGSPVATRLAA